MIFFGGGGVFFLTYPTINNTCFDEFILANLVFLETNGETFLYLQEGLEIPYQKPLSPALIETSQQQVIQSHRINE